MCGGALMRILLGLLFFGVHDTSECPLMIQPSTVVVRYGDPVSVNCTVLGYYEGIGWEASEGSVGMVSDVQFVTWSLETLTDWEIRPRCFGNFLTGPDSGFQCEKKLNITVYKPPDSVSISAVNHAGPMLEGEQYQLQCEVQNIAPVQYLTVKWYKGETLENQTSYDALTKTPVNVSSTLLITPIGADDGAQYSCVAELELGPEGPQPPPEVKSDPFNIIVHYPPSEIFEPESDAVDLGASVVLKCSSQGNPQPRYRWTYPRAANVLENSVDGVSLLHIFNASEENNGSYTCYAQNRIGHVNKTVSLIVRGKNTTTTKPPGSVSISAVNHTGPMLEGKQYRLQCEVQIIAPVQDLTVKWYKRETSNKTYDALIKTPVNVSPTLLITPTSADDGAQYSCVVELELGPYKSDPLNITVHYKPRITQECPDNVKLRDGESLDTLFSCRTEGNPSPVVTWYRNQSEFNSSTQLTRRDAGLYVMTAKNTLGNVNIPVVLCPFKMEPSTVVVRYGDPVSVNCTVPGDHEGIGWEASEGSVKVPAGTQYVTWSLETLTDWEIRPTCFTNFQTGPDSGFQCDEKLNITVYKPSDSVFISAMNHIGPMLEGKQYQLRCEVQNIAPVQYLTVKWYKGETLENQTSYDALTKKPVTVSSTVLITPTSADDGAQYRCVAVLELGPEGPQPPPSYKSDPLNITVHYKPRITECLGHVKLREGESLDTLASCRAEGNPFPMVTWYRDQSEFNSSTQLTKRQGGQYTLIAKNTYGTANHTLEIEVLYKPRITECPDHVTLREGESLDTLVSCRAEGNPSPMVTWYRDQSEFNGSAALTQRNVGQYTFMAKNPLGNITWTVNLTMSHPPNGRSICLTPVRCMLFLISIMNFICF